MIWLFAGGGEAELGEREGEVQGIVHFLEKHFPDFIFHRITPVRNKRPPTRVKTNASLDALGKTGDAFAKQIKAKLNDAIRYKNPLCDLLLVLDDLDCACETGRKTLFANAIAHAANGKFSQIPHIIGFAAPELESWVLADWGGTVAKHIDFRQNHAAMQSWLKAQAVPFENPESFSSYNQDKEACQEKLSELLIESSCQHNSTPYSKAKHSPFLLLQINPDIVAKKCPLFREFFSKLQALTPNSE